MARLCAYGLTERANVAKIGVPATTEVVDALCASIRRMGERMLDCCHCGKEPSRFNAYGAFYCDDICADANQDWIDFKCPDDPTHRVLVHWSSELWEKDKIHWRTDLWCKNHHAWGGELNSDIYIDVVKKLDERTGPHVFGSPCWCSTRAGRAKAIKPHD